MTVLDRILAETRQEVDRRKQQTPIETDISSRRPNRFRDALVTPGISVIAEFKRRSPSAGKLREPDIDAARDACGLPILRKDFVVDSYQLYEAVAADADAVLLIVAALEQEELALLHDCALGLGLDVLVEVHDRDELARAEQVGARLIGVNNRDLRDFSVDVGRTERLLTEMPAGTTVVSESGISEPQQLEQLQRAGVAAVLVGESLMRAPEPEQALAKLLAGSSVRV
jgi:indole-3-glycerol phosphate synthase